MEATTLTAEQVEALLQAVDSQEADDRDLGNHQLDPLVGQVVLEIWVGCEEKTLFLKTIEHIYCLSIDSECCSESWFADFFGFSVLIGSEIKSVCSIDLEDKDLHYNIEDGRGRQESDVVYGYSLRTQKGTAVFSFRNSSNGYYDGWLEDLVTFESIPSSAIQIAPLSGCNFWQAP